MIESNYTEINDEDICLNFGVVAVIGRVDKRLYIGGNAIHAPVRNHFGVLGPDAKGNVVIVGIQEEAGTVDAYYFNEFMQ